MQLGLLLIYLFRKICHCCIQKENAWDGWTGKGGEITRFEGGNNGCHKTKGHDGIL